MHIVWFIVFVCSYVSTLITKSQCYKIVNSHSSVIVYGNTDLYAIVTFQSLFIRATHDHTSHNAAILACVANTPPLTGGTINGKEPKGAWELLFCYITPCHSDHDFPMTLN